jgi:DNA-binding response OmpR family regulator
VLVVDDSDLACEAVNAALSGHGIRVATINSPFGFIKLVHEERPDLILIDVGLGSINGTKLVDLARQHSPPDCVVLLYSGQDEDSLRDVASSCGADGCISKQTSGRALVDEVKRWLKA